MEGIWIRKKRATAVHKDKRTMKGNKENSVYAAHVAGVDQQISAVFCLEDAAAFTLHAPPWSSAVHVRSFLHKLCFVSTFIRPREKLYSQSLEMPSWHVAINVGPIRLCRPQTCVYVSAFKLLILNFALMVRLGSGPKTDWLWVGKHHVLAWNNRFCWPPPCLAHDMKVSS